VVVLEIRSILVRLLAEKGSGRPLMKHANQRQVSDTYRYLYIALSELWDFEKQIRYYLCGIGTSTDNSKIA
jgi:hypothetical protein